KGTRKGYTRSKRLTPFVGAAMLVLLAARRRLPSPFALAAVHHHLDLRHPGEQAFEEGQGTGVLPRDHEGRHDPELLAQRAGGTDPVGDHRVADGLLRAHVLLTPGADSDHP